jgi:hypothetical protein
MDDRMSRISSATRDPRIMNPKRKINQVSTGMRSSQLAFVGSEDFLAISS